MLLFFVEDSNTKKGKSSFNTSHVVVFLLFLHVDPHVFEVSIHLMLLFFKFGRFGYSGTVTVSIHLMLLFFAKFQTNTKDGFGVSIHLMLLFFFVNIWRIINFFMFQYISCCCFSPILICIFWFSTVSIHLMLLFFH